MPSINEFSVGIGFGSTPVTVSPTWTYLDSVDGIRVMSWQVSRGRPNELEKTSAGTATVVVADYQGVLDPTNSGSPYYPDVLPDCQALIRLYDPVHDEWDTIFRGYIEDIDYELRTVTYEGGGVEGVVADKGVAFVTLSLVDAFGWLNDCELMPYPAAGDAPPAGSEGRVFYEDTNEADSVDSRIFAILADADWPSGLSSIFSGNVRVTETTYEPGTSALSALFDAADAEFPAVANLFVAKDGTLTFHGRQARFRPDIAEYGIGRHTVGDPSVTTDPTVAPIAELSWGFGKTFIYNSVLVLPQDVTVGVPPTEDEAAAALDEDSSSITQHGTKGLSFTDLLTVYGRYTGNDGLGECAGFALYYRANYSYPLPRITRMVFKAREPAHRLAGPLWRFMCRVEISDLLTVFTSHLGGGGFGEGYFVEGIRYDCRPGNQRVHEITLELDVSPQALFATNPFEEDEDP